MPIENTNLRATKYSDIELTPSERRRLYQKWWNIKNKPCSPSFKDFHKFCEWAKNNGYDESGDLRRYDSSGEFSEHNCYWTSENDETLGRKIRQASIDKWNKTVNSIRKYYGMPPIEEVERSAGYEST